MNNTQILHIFPVLKGFVMATDDYTDNYLIGSFEKIALILAKCSCYAIYAMLF